MSTYSHRFLRTALIAVPLLFWFFGCNTIDNSMNTPPESKMAKSSKNTPEEINIEAEDKACSWIRGTSVDNNHSGYKGKGFVNTPNHTGAWTQCKVKVKAAGSYRIKVRYANGSSGRAAQLIVNGKAKATGAFASTGNWGKWDDEIFTGISLKAGTNTVRLSANTPGGLGNIDYFTYNVSGEGSYKKSEKNKNQKEESSNKKSKKNKNKNDVKRGPTPEINIEAEDKKYCSWIRGSSVDNNYSGYKGKGFVNTPNHTGAWTQCKVKVKAAGSYRIEVRYANGSSGRAAQLIVNGKAKATGAFASTGNWGKWDDEIFTGISLKAGTNTVRLSANTTGGLGNIDYFAVKGGGQSDVKKGNAYIVVDFENNYDIPDQCYIDKIIINGSGAHITLPDQKCDGWELVSYKVPGKGSYNPGYKVFIDKSMTVTAGWLEMDEDQHAVGECIVMIPAGSKYENWRDKFWADRNGCTYILDGHSPDLDINIAGDDITLKGKNRTKMLVREVVVKSYARNSKLEYLWVKPPCEHTGIKLEEYSKYNEGKKSDDFGTHLRIEGNDGAAGIDIGGNRNVFYNKDIYIYDIYGDGIRIDDTWGNGNIHIKDCVIENYIDNGIWIQDTYGSVHISQCEVINANDENEAHNGTGVKIENSKFSPKGYFDVDTDNNFYGFKLFNTSNVTIHSPGSHNNKILDLWIKDSRNYQINENDFPDIKKE